jgi:hypothetical protein
MAVARGNPLLDGLHGRVGELVFRRLGEHTIVSQRPSRRRPPKASEQRERTVSRFREAVAFAREARHTPAFRSLARALRGYSPYHLAIQDYLSEPVIESVDDSEVGSTGGPVTVVVSERIEVRSVEARMLVGGESVVIRGERVLGARTMAGQERRRPPGPPGAKLPATPAELFFRRPAASPPPPPPPPPPSQGTAGADSPGDPQAPLRIFTTWRLPVRAPG